MIKLHVSWVAAIVVGGESSVVRVKTGQRGAYISDRDFSKRLRPHRLNLTAIIPGYLR